MGTTLIATENPDKIKCTYACETVSRMIRKGHELTHRDVGINTTRMFACIHNDEILHS